MKRFSMLIRAFSSNVGGGVKSSAAAPSAPKVDPLKNVTGLTNKCVQKNAEREVPGTGQQYQNIEYFGYNQMSFSEAEVEMFKYRIPQPVAPRK